LSQYSYLSQFYASAEAPGRQNRQRFFRETARRNLTKQG